jgi:hypothetical protein
MHIQVKDKGCGGAKPIMGIVKIHLKKQSDGKIYEFKLSDDITLGDLTTLITDVFDEKEEVKLFQEGAELSLADVIRDWVNATGGRTQVSLKSDIMFEDSEEVEFIPTM